MTYAYRPLWLPQFIDYTEKIKLGETGLGTFNSYLHDLDLSLTDLRGKKILDIGSGRGLFGKAVTKFGIAKFVVSLDDGFVVKAMDVQGKAEFLPFKDECLDLVLDKGLISMIHFDDGRTDLMLQTLHEMLRVASRGGCIKIQSVESARPHWGRTINKRELGRRSVIMEDLESIIRINPELIMQITKLSHSPYDYDHLLEIRKP